MRQKRKKGSKAVAKPLPIEINQKECCICSSINSVRNVGCKGKYYCGKHRGQLKRHGKILDRTRFDKNKITMKDGCCIIELYDKNGNFKAETFIDEEDVEKIKGMKWHLYATGYVVTTKENKKDLRIHRLVLGLEDNKMDVDHINHNKLDNRKANLRVVTRSQNLWNKNSKGYCYDNFYNKWIAYIGVNKKQIRLGYFKTEAEAKNSRLEAERKYYGEYAYSKPKCEVLVK